MAELEALRPIGVLGDDRPENPWLLDLFTATRDGVHEADSWLPDDRRRRATMRILGRTTVLHGADTDLTWTEAVESTVVFGDALDTDPVLAAIKEAEWPGGAAAAELFGQRVAAAVGGAGLLHRRGGRSTRTAAPEELQAWLADQMPDVTVGAFMDDEPPATMAGQASGSGRADRARRRRRRTR